MFTDISNKSLLVNEILEDEIYTDATCASIVYATRVDFLDIASYGFLMSLESELDKTFFLKETLADMVLEHIFANILYHYLMKNDVTKEGYVEYINNLTVDSFEIATLGEEFMTTYHITGVPDDIIYVAVTNALRIVLSTPEASAGMVKLANGISETARGLGVPKHEIVNIFYTGKIRGKATTGAIFYMLITYTP